MKEKIQQLVNLLNQASEAYYNGKQELLTDYEWDAKFDELKQLEEQSGIVLPDSPTQKVSEDNVAGRKEQHEFAALSLAKTKKIDDIVKWSEGKPIWISWKLDGLTLVATYDNGRLSRLVTRGNGHVGTNITYLATAINGLPKTINYREHLVVRGEAVISYNDFNNFLIESGEDYANPRNLASGTMTLHDVEEVRRRKVNWIAFTLLTPSQPSWGEQMKWLEQQGFNVVERTPVSNPTHENINKVINDFTLKVTSETNPYPVDGLVVTYDDTEFAQTGSVTGHHATRAGLAFKWQDEAAETKLERVEWSCAANNISPVAVFEPVELEGTTVRRASLCNISECERLGIGDKGTRLQVIKANKIIPKVIKVEEKIGKFQVPEKCPVCHQPTVITLTQTKILRCTNADCPAKELKKFVRFVSKEALDIDGLSEQTLSLLINKGYIAEYSDIYNLKKHSGEMERMAGFGLRSVSNLLAAIEKSRQTEPHRLLYSLTIPLCGTEVCRRMLKEYKLAELIDIARTTTDQEAFSNINGIGKEKSSAFISWMQNDKNYDRLQRLMAEINLSDERQSSSRQLCEGLTFVITGELKHYSNRNELKDYIEQEGGHVAGSVSKNTDYLINNDVTSTSGKNKKAQELGVKIISEDEFIKQYASENTTENNNKSQPQQLELF